MYRAGQYLYFIVLTVLLSGQLALAQTELQISDIDGDGTVTFTAFGDSLTYGVGDGQVPGEYISEAPKVSGGYPQRLESYGIETDNEGIPGEVLTENGVFRFPAIMQSAVSDYSAIFEGLNDAIFLTPTGYIRESLQRMINTARALGSEVLLFSLPVPCCNHVSLAPFADDYNLAIYHLALLNDIRLVDVNRAWKSTCSGNAECELFNMPEGLHPNSSGYDVIAELVMGALTEVDVFSQAGNVELADFLGFESGLTVLPDEEVE